jgi:hypothetical protein
MTGTERINVNESGRVRGIRDLKLVTDELRALRTIRQQFSSERATHSLLRSAAAAPCAPFIAARRIASAGESVGSGAHTKIISDIAVIRSSQVVACERQVTA